MARSAHRKGIYRRASADGKHPARRLPQEACPIASKRRWTKSDAGPPKHHGDSREGVSFDGGPPLHDRLWSDPHQVFEAFDFSGLNLDTPLALSPTLEVVDYGSLAADHECAGIRLGEPSIEARRRDAQSPGCFVRG